MAVPRKVVKVQVHQQPLKSAKVEEGATYGAQVGVNLFDRDGTLITSLTQVITQVAQTIYAVGATSVSWGSISGLLSSQIDLVDALLAKANLAGDNFTGGITVPDEAYDEAAWNGSLEVPTKNAIRDKIETLGGGSGTTDERDIWLFG